MRFIAVNMKPCGRSMRTWTRPIRARDLIVGLVVRAEQHAVQPPNERLFEPLDLSGAARDGGARARVSLDGGVEVVDDRNE